MRNRAAENPYETDTLLSQYCEFHYGDEYFGVGNFPACCARRCLELMAGRRKGAALDAGCAVGRTTFELAREFAAVTGVDSSRRFIDAANAMRDEGRLSYGLVKEGELTTRVERRLVDFELDGVRDRVDFVCADALSLPSACTGYDLVFAGNLIDRLKSPRRFLLSLPPRINPGGLLVLASPYTWCVEFTPRAEWL
nr:putative 4-mercaptohistidine N1-methyltransferase [Geobacteraceae bacterium]